MNFQPGHANHPEDDHDDENAYYYADNKHEYGEFYHEEDHQLFEQDNQKQQGFAQQRDVFENYQMKKPQNAPMRFDATFQRGNSGEDQRSAPTTSSNKMIQKPKGAKQPTEEDEWGRDFGERKRSEDTKETANITENIDPTKVKTSKLFQKFLQNQNKENPSKVQPPKEITPSAKGNAYPISKESKDVYKNKPPAPVMQNFQGSRQYEGTYTKQDQDQSGEDFRLKERNTPTYEDEDEYRPPLKQGESSGRHDQQSPKQQSFYREDNGYGYGVEPGNVGVDLNFQSSSKLVSLQNSELYPQNMSAGFQGQPPNGPYVIQNPYQYMGYGVPAPGQQQQFQMGPINEVFILRAQVMELNQALAREIEANKALDSKCSEYLSQLEQSAHNFGEFKHKILDQDSGHQEEVRRLEEKLQSMGDALGEKERLEEQHLAEINRLRRKLDAELESRGRLLEEHDELERRRFDELERVKRELEQKDEELQRLKRDMDSTRQDKDSFRSTEERYVKEIKSLKGEILDLNRANEDLRKMCDDKHQQVSLGRLEINSLRDQLDKIDGQYRDLLSENDYVKRENFNLKERVLASESDIKSLQLALDKAQRDASQASEALARTEKALERERQTSGDLRAQISSGSRNNQWEAPSNYPKREYSPKRQNRQYDDSRDQGYSQKGDDYRDNYKDNQQAKYEQTRQQTRQQYALQEEDNYQPQKRQGLSNRSNQDDYKAEPSKGLAREGNNYSRGGLKPTLEERAGSYSQGVNNNRDNKYEDRFNKVTTPQTQQDEIRKVNQDPYERPPSRNEGGKGVPAGKSSLQNEFGQPLTKLSSQNQVYKPTYNLLAWDEPVVENKPVNNRGKDQRQNQQTPPRGKSQIRQERDVAPPSNVNNANRKQGQFGSGSGPAFGREERPQQHDPQEIKTLENDLMNLQMQKDNLTNELQRLDKVKIKSGAVIKRKQEIDSEMNQVQSNISNRKNRLRELNVLHSY